MKTCIASMAGLAVAEETVLLQVKVTKDPMNDMMPPPPPAGTDDMPPMDDTTLADMDDFTASGETMPPMEPLEPPAAFTEDMEDFEDDMEEFDVTPFTPESIDAFVEANEDVVDEFMETGNMEFLEEAIVEFCEEDPEAPEGCADAATELAYDAYAEMGEHHQEEPHDDDGLTDCEDRAIWEHWHCTPDWMSCEPVGDMLHVNDARVCEKTKDCDWEDWGCFDGAWQAEFPMCQWNGFETVYGDVKGFPSVEEVLKGPPDNWCMIDDSCIHAELGPDGWNNMDIDWGSFWGNVDACTCEGIKGVKPNRKPEDSWYVGYFKDICGPEEPPMYPDTMYPAGEEDDFMPDMYLKAMKHRFSMARKAGATKKQAMVASGLVRHVDMKALAKKKVLKAAKLLK